MEWRRNKSGGELLPTARNAIARRGAVGATRATDPASGKDTAILTTSGNAIRSLLCGEILQEELGGIRLQPAVVQQWLVVADCVS